MHDSYVIRDGAVHTPRCGAAGRIKPSTSTGTPSPACCTGTVMNIDRGECVGPSISFNATFFVCLFVWLKRLGSIIYLVLSFVALVCAVLCCVVWWCTHE